MYKSFPSHLITQLITARMVSVFLIISIILTVVAIAFGGIYMAGMLDTVIEKIGIYVLRTKAKAEEKTLEAQGLKEGQDFFKGE